MTNQIIRSSMDNLAKIWPLFSTVQVTVFKRIYLFLLKDRFTQRRTVRDPDEAIGLLQSSIPGITQGWKILSLPALLSLMCLPVSLQMLQISVYFCLYFFTHTYVYIYIYILIYAYTFGLFSRLVNRNQYVPIFFESFLQINTIQPNLDLRSLHVWNQ